MCIFIQERCVIFWQPKKYRAMDSLIKLKAELEEKSKEIDMLKQRIMVWVVCFFSSYGVVSWCSLLCILIIAHMPRLPSRTRTIIRRYAFLLCYLLIFSIAVVSIICTQYVTHLIKPNNSLWNTMTECHVHIRLGPFVPNRLKILVRHMNAESSAQILILIFNCCGRGGMIS